MQIPKNTFPCSNLAISQTKATHTHSLSHTHTLSLTHTHTLSHTHTHKLTYTHTSLHFKMGKVSTFEVTQYHHLCLVRSLDSSMTDSLSCYKQIRIISFRCVVNLFVSSLNSLTFSMEGPWILNESVKFTKKKKYCTA